jgi:hypothetical protein
MSPVRRSSVPAVTVQGIAATTQAITLYVATTGSDTTGTGAVGAPYATLTKALSTLPKVINHMVVINVAAGTYSEDVLIDGFMGTERIIVFGGDSLANAVNYVFTRFQFKGNTCYTLFAGFKLSTTTNTAIHVNDCTHADFNICTAVGSATGQYGFSIHHSRCHFNGCSVSNRFGALFTNNALVMSDSWTAGSGNTLGIEATTCSFVTKNGTQPQGTTAQAMSGGAEIR